MDAAPLTLGTAGHIDHGKTALIGALTGVDTDRLPEERARGISIELGYARLVLPSGRALSVVDVPGHERFVRTMVAGATGIDLFLLVVAADDGVMPQTREHLAVLDLLGVSTGVVALTKIDRASEESTATATAAVRDLLATARFADAPIVPGERGARWRARRAARRARTGRRATCGRARTGRSHTAARGPLFHAQGHRHRRHRDALVRRGGGGSGGVAAAG